MAIDWKLSHFYKCFLQQFFFLKIKNVHFTTIHRSTNILLAIILDSCLLDFVNTTIIYCKATNKDLFINGTTVVKNKLYAKPTFLKMKNRVKCNRSISPIVFVSWYTWKPVVDCASHVGSCPCPPSTHPHYPSQPPALPIAKHSF